MNNKGFAITSIIYGLMLLFVMVVASFISVLVGRNRRMDDLLEGVRESLDYPVFTVTYQNDVKSFSVENDKGLNTQTYENNSAYFITKYRGLYDFTNSGYSSCKKYLPKGLVIVYANFFDASINGLYYNTKGGTFTTDTSEENYYQQLCS